ncbi:MAG: 4-amino-4-deoxy-L-arabinose transferase-like glycosyltransferase [Myxococcota bacterium]|jgi:4-amino-4-deoxy-L-arabinose transferase-like glycosyltransferase
MSAQPTTPSRLRASAPAEADDALPSAAMASLTTPTSHRELLLVLSTAFVVRLAYFIELIGFPLFTGPTADTLKYLGRAEEILAGSWLGEGVYFHSSPIYSYLLAAAIGTGAATPLELSSVAWLQLLASVGTAGLTWAAARARSGPRAGLIAGLLYALSPGAVFYDGELLGDFILPLVAAAAAWVALSRPLTLPRLVGLGAIIGFGALARPNYLVLLGPLAILVHTTPWKSWAARTAALSLGAALMVAPVTLRNATVGGDVVMISSNGGVNLYIGNGPGSTGAFSAPAYWGSGLEAYSTREAEATLGRPLKPSEVSAHYTSRALLWIRENPAAYLALVGRRLRLVVGGYEIPNHMDLNFFAQQSRVLRWLPARWGLVLPLAGAGAVLATRRSVRSTLPLLMVAFYLGSIAALFFVTGRYRFPIFPLLAALVGAGAVAWPTASM